MNGLDNRNKIKSSALEEIENDTSVIDEEESPKEEETTIEDPEQEEETLETTPDKEEEEVILDSEEEIDQETGEAKPKVKVKAPEKQVLPDVEERLAAQRREATILHERNKQLTDAFSKVDEVKDPTEEDLQRAAQTEGFDWVEMDSFQKSMFKKNFVNDQKLAIVNNAVKGVKDIDQWAQSVDKYLDENETNQTNKSLIGKEGAFRAFAMQESHRGTTISVLASAFLHDYKAPTTPAKGSVMLTRTGGQRVEKKNNLKDADYVQNLRKTNPREYNRLISKGAISIDL